MGHTAYPNSWMVYFMENPSIDINWYRPEHSTWHPKSHCLALLGFVFLCVCGSVLEFRSVPFVAEDLTGQMAPPAAEVESPAAGDSRLWVHWCLTCSTYTVKTLAGWFNAFILYHKQAQNLLIPPQKVQRLWSSLYCAWSFPSSWLLMIISLLIHGNRLMVIWPPIKSWAFMLLDGNFLSDRLIIISIWKMFFLILLDPSLSCLMDNRPKCWPSTRMVKKT